jgi:hypothetical protein
VVLSIHSHRQGRGTGDLRVRHLLGVVEISRADADRAKPELASAVGELREQLLERRAALAGNTCGLARQPEPNGVFGRPDHNLFSLAERGRRDEEGDRDSLGVLEPRSEVDDDLRACCCVDHG